MEQQDDKAGPDPRPPDVAPLAQRVAGERQPDADSTWGQGSATALEYLRRHNYRGRRGEAATDRPQSD